MSKYTKHILFCTGCVVVSFIVGFLQGRQQNEELLNTTYIYGKLRGSNLALEYCYSVFQSGVKPDSAMAALQDSLRAPLLEDFSE